MNSVNIVTDAGSYTCGDSGFDLYVAMPEARSAKLPAVLVAPAWDGLNAPIEETTRRVAQLGYVAVAVDVYGKGVRGDLGGDNSSLMNPLVENRAELHARLHAAWSVIAQMPEVDRARMAAIGYCFGGLCVLDMARENTKGLCGVVSFHGVLGAGYDLDHAATKPPVQASVLLEHGWDDPMATPKEFVTFAKEMSVRKADWQGHAHGGALHAFTLTGANSPENGVAYHADADRRSWASMADFLAEVFA